MMDNPQNKRSAEALKDLQRKDLLNTLAVAEMQNGPKPGIQI